MFLHEMTVAQRLESIVLIATRLAGTGAHASFHTDWPALVFDCRRYDDQAAPGSAMPYTVLEVTAPGYCWKLGAPGPHTEAVESVLTHGLLLSLAHHAGVCPSCHKPMPRRRADGEQRYSCGDCGMQVIERL